jgi:hypothetical protein
MVRPTQGAPVARRIGEVPPGLHARADYPAAHGMPTSLEELRATGLIGVERDTPALRQFRARFGVDRADFIFRSARIRATFDHPVETDYVRAQPSVAASIAVAAPRKG